VQVAHLQVAQVQVAQVQLWMQEASLVGMG
jgi:hypothetical protein